jgi:hypothetical protein
MDMNAARISAPWSIGAVSGSKACGSRSERPAGEVAINLRRRVATSGRFLTRGGLAAKLPCGERVWPLQAHQFASNELTIGEVSVDANGDQLKPR